MTKKRRRGRKKNERNDQNEVAQEKGHAVENAPEAENEGMNFSISVVEKWPQKTTILVEAEKEDDDLEVQVARKSRNDRRNAPDHVSGNGHVIVDEIPAQRVPI